MYFIFVDEVCVPQKRKDFLGVGFLKVHMGKYKELKRTFLKGFTELGWEGKLEFKGKYIFSKKGDKNVSIEKRIDFVRKISEASVSNQNARYSFYFCYSCKGTNLEIFKSLLLSGLKKIIKCRDHRNGKDIYGIFLDSRDDIKPEDLVIDLEKLFEKRKCILFERPVLINSSNKTPGILTVDILSYLASWIVLNMDYSGLFEQALSEKNKQKLQQVYKIMSSIKNKYFWELR